MARFAVGDVVRVALPRGPNKRGIVGVSVLYATSPESRFDGAVGAVEQINPRGPYGIPLYLVNFRGHDNRIAIPWQSQWFREEWLIPEARRENPPPAKEGERAATGAAGAAG